MFKGINIETLEGVKKIIASKCDHNNDGILKSGKDYDEISVFNKACATLDDNNSFIIGGKAYNADGSINKTRKVPIDTKNPAILKEETQKINLAEIPPVRRPIEAAPRDATRVEVPPYIPPKLPKAFGLYSSVKTSYDWSEETLNKVLYEMTSSPRYVKKYGKSLLKNKAKAFIKSAEKYNVDPRLLIAIAMHESARGTQTDGKNSIGGTHKNFASVDESIDTIAKTIAEKFKAGYNTAYKIAPKYTGKQASATGWRNNVESYLNQINRLYKANLK